MRKIIKIFAHLNMVLGSILILAPMIFLGLYAFGIFTPKEVFAETAERETEIITSSNILTETISSNNSTVFESYKVFDIPQNASANFGNKITIPSIGIDTILWEDSNGIDALKKGVWRMPTHGAPDRNSEPIVLAAHRWGEDDLGWEYRSKNLFLNLPNLKAGDEIIITWFGQEYKYRVTYTETNTELSRVDDLILMTCQSYHSLNRIFVYAEKI